MDNNLQEKGAWIFLSHSHKDLYTIRKVRNEFERLGHNPIMFFLKCLDDDVEVDNLVKREIDARNWFVLCDSENSRNSLWVKTEVEYIKSLPDKKFYTINLEENWLNQLSEIHEISKELTVFISHHHKDYQIAELFYNELIKHEFAVFLAQKSIKIGEPYAAVIRDSVSNLFNKNGYFLLLLSSTSTHSLFINKELELLLNRSQDAIKKIIIVVLEDYDECVAHWTTLYPQLNSIHFYNITEENKVQKIKQIVNEIKFN